MFEHALVASMGGIPTKSDVETLALLLLVITATQCQGSCPRGTYKAWQGNWCCKSSCGPGTEIESSCSHYNPDDTVCKDCGPNYYNPYPDQFDCQQKDLCNKHNEEIKVSGNSTANNECQCKVGFYRVVEMCLRGPACPPGSGATRRGRCEACPHGTFSNLTSHTQPCITWQSCRDLGYLEHRPGTNTSDTVCISHPIDTLQPTERPEMNSVTPVIPNKDANITDSMNGDKRSATSNPTILGMSVGISVGVSIAVAVILVLAGMLVRRFRRKRRHEIVLEYGEQPDSKTLLDPQEREANDKNVELKNLMRTEKEGNHAAGIPDPHDIMVTDEDPSTGGPYPCSEVQAETISDTEQETCATQGQSTMQHADKAADKASETHNTVTGDNNIFVTAGYNAVININQDPRNTQARRPN